MKSASWKSLATLFFLCLCLSSISAQKKKKKKNKDVPKSEVASFEEQLKGCKAYEGLFVIYQDTLTGKLMLKVSADQLEKEFIHFSYVENGLSEIGMFRGNYRKGKIFTIKRSFDKLIFQFENTSFYFNPDHPISKASEANINTSVWGAEKILAENKEKDAYLIDADKLFLTETLGQLKYVSANPKKNAFNIGNLSKDKTRCLEIRNYPENTDLIIDYVFENQRPTNYGSSATTDARFISIKFQHSWIAMPDNDYQPRFDDQRIGYFTTQVTDQTSTDITPYRDMIHRWNLVKKDPKASISEPVKPIVFWMEKTTPKELRPIIKAAVETWNKAFEKAGFKNAVQVKQQPDDATWDAGDIRYNVLRWTSSPQPPFGGYGPSFVNPRTGEILCADIMLEFIYLTNRTRHEEIFDLNQSLEDMIQYQETAPSSSGHQCHAVNCMHQNILFGKFATGIFGTDDISKSKLIRESITGLVLHEVGHTLGLNHNFKSSQLHDRTTINNEKVTKEVGLISSVMDYAPLNIALDPKNQGQFITTCPGPYDIWAIEFGYTPSEKDLTKEKERVDDLLSRSADTALGFGNDADDMRYPGKGSDPTIMINDMSSDAIGYAIDRIKLCKKTLSNIDKKLLEDGKSYQALYNANFTINSRYQSALGIISRYIGGIKIDRSMVGTPNAPNPLTPISYKEQKRAMAALREYGFSPTAFQFENKELYTKIHKQRRGFSHWGRSTDPKIHGMILTYQKSLLAHLLHPKVLTRIVDSELYNNKYGITEMLTDLSNAIFEEDLKSTVNTARQNLQITYVDGLITAMNGKVYGNVIQANMMYQLTSIQKLLETNQGKDNSTKAHRAFVLHKIEKALAIKG